MDTALSPPAGQLLGGRYHVGSRIARGGMATVYLGTDTRLDRVVAIKIAHPELSDDAEFVRRFIGEAKSAAKLSSPNVVAVYDQGTVVDPGSGGWLHYIAMEYVPGRTLRQLLSERGRLAPRDALDIMAGVLSGLAAAHQAGFAHRDVKPENVLLTDSGAVKVADFGLARSVAGAVQTRGGMIIGTAAYLAPEQISGGTSDARTDVYAAGIMLYELLTGAQPHVAESPLAVAYKHVNEVVPPPSRVLPGLSPALDALVALATSRDPELRPVSAGQYLRAVADVRNGRGLPMTVPASGPIPPGPGQYHGTSGPLPGHVDPYREQAAFGQAPGAVGASALPSLGPQSAQVAPFPPTPLDGQLDATNRTLVVRDSDPYGLAPGGYGPPGYGPPGYGPAGYGPAGYGYRARGRRARGQRSEPWWHQWLFGRRFAYLAGGLAVVLATALAIWWLSAGQYTSVPQLHGLLASTAKTELKHLGLRAKLGDPQHSDSVPRGEVISTTPGSGSRVTGGTIVTMIVSLGPIMIQVPNVTGQPLAQAEAALRLAHLIPGVVRRAASSTVPSGNVITTTPPAFTSWPANKPVGLIISAGLPLPNFVGLQVSQAQQAAQQGGYTINPVPDAHSTLPPNTITSQSPAPNTPISPGEVVTVHFSQGPQNVPVPNVQGLSVKDAVKILTKAGFQVNVQQLGPGNTVGRYDPTGQAPQGSTITIYVGLFAGL
jgi:serine/threonine-protein kinase